MSLFEYRKAIWEIMSANLDEELEEEGEGAAETLDELILTLLCGADPTTLLSVVSFLSSKGERYQKAATAVLSLIDQVDEKGASHHIRMIAADPALEEPPILICGDTQREVNRHHVNIYVMGNPHIASIAEEQPDLLCEIESNRVKGRYYAALSLFYASDAMQRVAPAGHVVAERMVETVGGYPIWN